jgi:hypothetical protein
MIDASNDSFDLYTYPPGADRNFFDQRLKQETQEMLAMAVDVYAKEFSMLFACSSSFF